MRIKKTNNFDKDWDNTQKAVKDFENMLKNRRCIKCGKKQELSKKDSNKNWNAYKTECKCGGYLK